MLWGRKREVGKREREERKEVGKDTVDTIFLTGYHGVVIISSP